MIRVLEVFGEPIISGGQEAFVNNVVENINWYGLCIDLFTPYYCENKLYKKNIEERGGNIYTGDLNFNPGRSRLNIKKPLIEVLNKKKYDVVHVHSGSVSVLAIVAQIAKRYSVNKIIVHSHSPAEYETLKHILVKIIYKRVLETCPKYYFACSLNAAVCKFPKDIAMNKTQYIKNGINLEKYEFNVLKRKKIRDKLGLKDNDYLIGHVGRFSKEKNHEFLIQIMNKIINDNFDAKMILIGDGDLKEEIQEEVYKLNLQNNIYFTGSVDNVDEYMQAIDCFVLPSIYEGLPFVGIEAQASGMPIIVSTGVSPELKLSDSVQYEELNLDKWVEEIKRSKGKKRIDNVDILRNSGFDIKQTASVLQDIYTLT